jgi:hypothetical protein
MRQQQIELKPSGNRQASIEPTGKMQVFDFTSGVEFKRCLSLCLSRARVHLDLFDPDFSIWGWGTPKADAELRRFLAGNGRVRMVGHDYRHLKNACPRFMRLLQDFSHAIECRSTNSHMQHLADSFCIADDLHLVRRFHCNHLRGIATFDDAAGTRICAELFERIWRESRPGLKVGCTGL